MAIGASPIMARAEEEVEEISSKSNALALNLGVPESTTAHSMILAGEAAMKKEFLSYLMWLEGVNSHQETYEVQETSQENAQQESTEIEQAAVSE